MTHRLCVYGRQGWDSGTDGLSSGDDGLNVTSASFDGSMDSQVVAKGKRRKICKRASAVRCKVYSEAICSYCP